MSAVPFLPPSGIVLFKVLYVSTWPWSYGWQGAKMPDSWALKQPLPMKAEPHWSPFQRGREGRYLKEAAVICLWPNCYEIELFLLMQGFSPFIPPFLSSLSGCVHTCIYTITLPCTLAVIICEPSLIQASPLEARSNWPWPIWGLAWCTEIPLGKSALLLWLWHGLCRISQLISRSFSAGSAN